MLREEPAQGDGLGRSVPTGEGERCPPSTLPGGEGPGESLSEAPSNLRTSGRLLGASEEADHGGWGPFLKLQLGAFQGEDSKGQHSRPRSKREEVSDFE